MESPRDGQNGVARQPLLSQATTSHCLPSKENTISKVHFQDPNEKIAGHKTRSLKLLKGIETGWCLEAFFLLLSAVCMISIVVFLSIHQNAPLESWTFYFSLNTVVATLGVLFRSTLIMAVSAALAQGKWIWFHKRNSSLSTFETIDAGSRETLGSFKLLWHMRGQHLVSAGAIVMALGFMIEPFLQAVISDSGLLVSVPIPTNATITKSQMFDGGTQCVTPMPYNYPKVDTTPDFAVSAAFLDGLNTATGGAKRDATFHCASGNCTWNEYASLAICSSCHDISRHLRNFNAGLVKRQLQAFTDGSVTNRSAGIPSQTFTAKPMYDTVPVLQPTGSASSSYRLDYLDLNLSNFDMPLREWRSPEGRQGTIFTAKITADQNQTINFRNSQTLLAAFTMIRASDEYVFGNATWPHGGATATECGLSLCLNVYRSNVTKGFLNENIVASASQKISNSWLPRPEQDVLQLHDNVPTDPETQEHNPVYHKGFLYRDDYQLDPSALNRSNIKGPFNLTQRGLLTTIDFISSLIDDPSVQMVASSSKNTYIYGSPILQPLYNSKNLSETFDVIARSVSNAIRGMGATPQQGTTQQWVIHYKVRWGFLALPLSLIIIGTVFFIISIFETRKAHLPSWKSNSIATMMHGPDETLRQHLRTTTQNHSINVASKTIVGLEDLHDGHALTMSHQSVTETTRPRTPSRDGEAVVGLKIPSTPQTPGSTLTLVEPQSVVSGEQGSVRSVSPALMRFDWEANQIDEPPSPLESLPAARTNG